MKIFTKDPCNKVENDSMGTARYILVLYLLVAFYKLLVTGIFVTRTYTSSPSSAKFGHYRCFCRSKY
jgi:hypothetical protein